jgi:hypothetical protein
MRYPFNSAGAATLACALALGPASAQSTSDSTVAPAVASKQAREIATGDPARWYREDATEQARLRTLHKEIGAAHEEAKAACRKEASGARACLKQARATWQQDMAHARDQLGAGPGPASGNR